jgi:hypothetical protein
MSGIDNDSAQSQSNRSCFFGNLKSCQHLGFSKARTKDSCKPSDVNEACHVMFKRTHKAASQVIHLGHFQVREENYSSETLEFVSNTTETYEMNTHSVSGR